MLTTPPHFEFAIGASNPNEFDELWCVYEHLMLLDPAPLALPQLVYVSACKLIDVFTMREARNNSDWSLLAANGYPLLIRVIATTTDKSEAFNHMIKHVKALDPMPRCNLYGYNLFGQNRVLICNDGREFANQAEAARKLECSQSAVSQHLAGKMPSIKGYVLTYKAKASPR